MLRFLALTAVLFVIPFAVYSVWIMAANRRLPEQGDFPTGRVVGFSVLGSILVLIGLVWLALSEGSLTGDGQEVTSIERNVTG